MYSEWAFMRTVDPSTFVVKSNLLEQWHGLNANQHPTVPCWIIFRDAESHLCPCTCGSSVFNHPSDPFHRRFLCEFWEAPRLRSIGFHKGRWFYHAVSPFICRIISYDCARNAVADMWEGICISIKRKWQKKRVPQSMHAVSKYFSNTVHSTAIFVKSTHASTDWYVCFYLFHSLSRGKFGKACSSTTMRWLVLSFDWTRFTFDSRLCWVLGSSPFHRLS